MVNYDKLRGALVEKRVRASTIATRLGCSRQTVYNKLHGRTMLTLGDVSTICDLLDATASERDAIFFSNDR